MIAAVMIPTHPCVKLYLFDEVSACEDVYVFKTKGFIVGYSPKIYTVIYEGDIK